MECNLLSVDQVAASSLMTICQLIGSDMTALHLIPQLREVFDELAFSQEAAYRSTSIGRNMKSSKPSIDGDVLNEGRMDLVLALTILILLKQQICFGLSHLIFTSKLQTDFVSYICIYSWYRKAPTVLYNMVASWAISSSVP